MKNIETTTNPVGHETYGSIHEVAYGSNILLEDTRIGSRIELSGDGDFTDPIVAGGGRLQVVGVGPDGREASVFLTRDAVIGQVIAPDGTTRSRLEARLPNSTLGEAAEHVVIGEPWQSPLGTLGQVRALRRELTGSPMGFEEHRSGDSPFVAARQKEAHGLKQALLASLPENARNDALSAEALLRIERNRALLASSEAGRDLLPVYEAAVDADVRAAEVEIVATTEHLGRAYGDRRVALRLGDREEVEAAFNVFMERLPAARAEIAAQLGLAPGELTMDTVRAQNMLHEFGHVIDFLERGHSVVASERNEQLSALPLGPVPASALLDESHPRRQELSAQHSPEEVLALINAQAQAYRHITAEHAADQFAAKVLRANPDLLKATE